MKNVAILAGMGIFVISVVLVFSSLDSITGAVSFFGSEEVIENYAGEETVTKTTYSFLPNFKIHIDYDFDEKQLVAITKQIVDICKNQKNKQDCVQKEKGRFTVYDPFGDLEFELLDKCESEEKESFFAFVDYFERCYESESTDCACERGKPETGTFDVYPIPILEPGQRKGIEIYGPDFELNDFSADIFDKEIDADLESITKNNILHKDTEGNLVVSPDLQKDQCVLKPKRKFRFCVKKPGKTYVAYNEKTKQVEEQELIYKFAIEFTESKIEKTKEDGYKESCILIMPTCDLLSVAKQLETEIEKERQHCVEIGAKETPPPLTDAIVEETCESILIEDIYSDRNNIEIKLKGTSEKTTTVPAVEIMESSVQRNNNQNKVLAAKIQEILQTDLEGEVILIDKRRPESDEIPDQSFRESVSTIVHIPTEDNDKFPETIKKALDAYFED